MYSRLYTHDRKIPIPLAILLILLIFALPLLFFRIKKTAQIQKPVIETISIANIGSTNVSVYWQSKAPSEGILYYSKSMDAGGISAVDDRDTNESLLLRTHHFVTLKNLEPNTIYYLWTQKNHKNTQPDQQFSTLEKSQLSTNKPPLYGKIANKNGSSVEGAIVYVKAKNASPLAALTKSDGTFLLSLCCLVHETSFEKINPADTDTIEIQVFDEGAQSHIIADISMASPLQKPIILGQSENLIVQKKEEEKISEETISEQTRDKFEAIDVFYPQDGAVIPGFRPLFKGNSVENGKITLLFTKQNKTITLTGDKKGGWSYTPDFNLMPGLNKIVMQTVDAAGRAVKRERSFTIAKSGESVVLGEATPEAGLSPTVTPLPIVTIEPTGEVIISETPTPPPPVTGVSFTAFSLMSVALIAIGAGLILLF